MADLFISYAREDRGCAEKLAQALSARGWSVWWDRHIQVGRSFSEVIEREIGAAKAVIVIWSRHSVESEWVQSEAAEAAGRKVLVPIRIEDVRMPLEFRRLQTADFFDWRNGFQGRDFQECLLSIEALVGTTAVRPLPHPAPQPPATPSPTAPRPAPYVAPTAAPQQPAGQQPTVPNYMVPAVVVTLLCCLPTGIVALINAGHVNSKLAAGDVAGAMAASAQAKTWCWISVGVGALFGAVAFIAGLMNGLNM